MKTSRTLILGLLLTVAFFALASAARAPRAGGPTVARGPSVTPAAAALAAEIARAQGACALAANPAAARVIQFGF